LGSLALGMLLDLVGESVLSAVVLLRKKLDKKGGPIFPIVLPIVKLSGLLHYPQSCSMRVVRSPTVSTPGEN
jgi:hypothetical protein